MNEDKQRKAAEVILSLYTHAAKLESDLSELI
jgi:hypothetical protein